MNLTQTIHSCGRPYRGRYWHIAPGTATGEGNEPYVQKRTTLCGKLIDARWFDLIEPRGGAFCPVCCAIRFAPATNVREKGSI